VSLAFLSADAATAGEAVARSPMERRALAAGAQLQLVHGWNVPGAYGEAQLERERLTRSVGFSDRSSLVKLELAAEPQRLAAVVALASGGDAALLPGLAARRATAGAGAHSWWCPVTPGRVLVLGEQQDAEALRAGVSEAAERVGGTAGVVDLTCGLAAMTLAGPQARELLARFCAIDVRPAQAPPMSFRPGSVARAPGYLLVEGAERLLVLVGSALGEYLWQVVADAAAQLGGGPVGARALAETPEAADA
jgi:heterotetrameric sarcosine oxidase gamma subunit